MRARLIGLAAAIGAAVVLCAGCQGMSGSSPAPAGQGTSDSGDPGQLGAELSQIQSTLDSVSAQINADSAP
ncbi:MAG TPA: hypothetical protein VFW65_28080 [Pseudonocardiaceae bacterium]|nr:hypothetical protein [Pseudonocardiaceae bacterium]